MTNAKPFQALSDLFRHESPKNVVFLIGGAQPQEAVPRLNGSKLDISAVNLKWHWEV